ncbi:hypothetical protein [Dongia sp.]|uniref:hypothetical protein n=1 Tax=Dongia sp. TaxID=1977262 RepID=UPI0035AFDB16
MATVLTLIVSSAAYPQCGQAQENTFYDQVGMRPATMLDIAAASINLSLRTNRWSDDITFHGSTVDLESRGAELRVTTIFTKVDPSESDCLDLWEEVRLVLAQAPPVIVKDKSHLNLCSSYELFFTPVTANIADAVLPPNASPCNITTIFVGLNKAGNKPGTLERVACLGAFLSDRRDVEVKWFKIGN